MPEERLRAVADAEVVPNDAPRANVAAPALDSPHRPSAGVCYATGHAMRDAVCQRLFTTVPEHFFESLTAASLSDGFIARLLVFEANATPARQRAGEQPVPDAITMLAYSGEPMHVEGWRFPVVVDLEGLSIPSQRRPVRFGQ